jgi:hypothetical protein
VAKQGIGHAYRQILDEYLVESFHKKEHRMVKSVRMDTISFEGSTSGQAEHENRSMGSSGGTNPMFALVRSLDAMISKTQQRYLLKLCEARKDIVWSLFGARGRGQKTSQRLESD